MAALRAPPAGPPTPASPGPTVAEDRLLDKVMEEMQRNPGKSIADVIDGLAEVTSVAATDGEVFSALEPLQQYAAHTCYVVCLAADGDLLFSAAWDGSINVWALALPDLVLVTQLTDRTLPSAPGVRAMRYEARDRLLYTGDQLGTVKAWSLNGLLGFKDRVQRVQQRVDGHAKDVAALECHGEWLLSGGLDGLVRVWRKRTLEPVATLFDLQRQQKNAQVWGLVADKSSQSVFAGGWPEVIYQWSLVDFALVRVLTLANTKGGTRAMACTGGHLYCGHWSGEITVWSVETGTLRHREVVDDAVHAVCPVGSVGVAIGGRNKQVSVYGLEEDCLSVLVKSPPGKAWINCLAVVGRCVMVGTATNTLEVLGLQTPQAAAPLPPAMPGQDVALQAGRFRCGTCAPPAPAACDECEARTVAYYTEDCEAAVREGVQRARTTLQLPRVQRLVERLVGERLHSPAAAPAGGVEEPSAAVLQSARELLQGCLAQVDRSLDDLRRRQSPPPSAPSVIANGRAPTTPNTAAPSRLCDPTWVPRPTGRAAVKECYPTNYVPAKTVEDTLRSIQSDVLARHFVDRLVRTANRFCQAKADLCPREQLAALFAYTYDIHDDELDDPVASGPACGRRRHDVQVHHLLRRALQGGASAELALWRPLLYHLDQALETLPRYSGLLCRRLRSPKEAYSVGQSIAWEGFLSCATLADADAAGPGVVCVITPRSARVLGPHSWTPETFEAVVPRDAVFRVTAVQPAPAGGAGPAVVELQEVAALEDFAWTGSG